MQHVLDLKRWTAMALVLLLLWCGCVGEDKDPLKEGRVIVEYWETWTNFEFDAINDIVNNFNLSQDEIYVNILSVSEIDRKVLIATAGNNPPDVFNYQNTMIPQLADRGALEPFEQFMPILNVKEEDYFDVFWKLCTYKGKLYGLPSTPTALALYWNKKLFREAGLDPEKPPRTIAELEEMSRKLTKKREDGSYEVLGYVQTQPNWWPYCWVHFFGGSWWDDEKGLITANSPENIATFQWIRDTAERLGPEAVQNFTSGLETSEAMGNGFFSGDIAMIYQGVWFARFIEQYTEGFEWGAAPFPSLNGDIVSTMAESGVFMIPKGAKHPQEAAKFIAYTQLPENQEYLSLKHGKFMALKVAEDMDYTGHPNREIEVFVNISKSPDAAFQPQMPIWDEYYRETINAFQEVWLGMRTPEDALTRVQKRMEKSWEKYQRIQRLIEEKEGRS
jgi:ABC-type glycerol-3-phosphate transport system substrate-binding protein